MGEKIIYLLKGLLFSALITAALMFLLAALMYFTGLSERLMAPLVVAAYVLATFIGGLYFSKHGERKRFLWGIVFGIAFFILYLLVVACCGTLLSMKPGEAIMMLVFSLVAGMAGGMVS